MGTTPPSPAGQEHILFGLICGGVIGVIMFEKHQQDFILGPFVLLI